MKIKISLLLVAVVSLSSCSWKQSQSEQIDLLFYGIFDNSKAYTDIIKSYEEQNRNVKITYRKLTFDEYFERLENEKNTGQPDIFMLPYFQVRGWINNLAPAKDIFPTNLQSDFVAAGTESCTWDNQVWCLPASSDNLALFYNPNLVPSPPKTWEEALIKAREIFQNSNGKIKGIALGVFNNITRAEEILSLLLLQNDTQFFNENWELTLDKSRGKDRQGYPRFPGIETREFWQSNETWNEDQPYFATEFAHGRLAMLIGYSWLINRIHEENSQANFTITKIPHFQGREEFSLGTGWVYAINRDSFYKDEGWNFLQFLTQKKNAANYAEKTQTIPARQDLLETKDTQNSLYDVFIQQVKTAHPLPEYFNWEAVFAKLREWSLEK